MLVAEKNKFFGLSGGKKPDCWIRNSELIGFCASCYSPVQSFQFSLYRQSDIPGRYPIIPKYSQSDVPRPPAVSSRQPRVLSYPQSNLLSSLVCPVSTWSCPAEGAAAAEALSDGAPAPRHRHCVSHCLVTAPRHRHSCVIHFPTSQTFR